MSTPAERLRAAGWELPPVPTPKGMYVTARRYGDLLELSGHGPFAPDGGFTHVGAVGSALSLDEGRAAAAAVALSLLASAEAALGDLAALAGVLRLTGYVNAAPGFVAHPAVLDGASEVLDVAFGAEGRPVRTVVGVAGLPFDLPVVAEATFLIGDSSPRGDERRRR